MRRFIRVALGLAVLVTPVLAQAQTSITVNDQPGLTGKKQARASDGTYFVDVNLDLISNVKTDYPFTAEDGRIKFGRERELSGYRTGLTVGSEDGSWECAADIRLVNLDGSLTADAGLPQFSKDFGGEPDAEPAGDKKPTTRRQRAAKVAKLFGDCNASVSTSLAQGNVKCETAAGTFDVTGKTLEANAGCGCDGCEAGAALVWFEGEWTSPSFGGCGIEGSVVASLEGGFGVKAGAQTLGTAGAKIKAGPIGGGLGFNLTSFNGGEALECLTDAVDAVKNGITTTARNISDSFNRLRSIFSTPPGFAGFNTGRAGGGSSFLRP